MNQKSNNYYKILGYLVAHPGRKPIREIISQLGFGSPAPVVAILNRLVRDGLIVWER